MSLSKRLAITGLCALVMGGIIAFVAFGALGFDASPLDTCEYEFGTVTAETLGAADGELSAEVNEIAVELTNIRVKLVGGDDFAFDYYTTDNLDVNYGFDKKSGKFDVESKHKMKPFSYDIFNGIKQIGYAYSFTVPRGATVRLRVVNCTVEANGVDAGQLIFDGANTTVILRDSEIDSVRFSSANGKLKAEESKFGSVDFAGNNATLKMRGCSGDFFDLDGNNAKFDVSISGQKSDFGLVSMTGSNATFRLCGEKFGGLYEGSGTKRFVARGNNATVKLGFEQ